ncbi:MAG TPA: LysM peptidoglycan-binding domain-containing protein [Tepidisphaeraceae bacterium]|jgi:LysM repeat protein
MRKDVKFGLTIGAILVVTLVVYVIVLSRGPAVPPKIGLAMPSASDHPADQIDSTPTPSATPQNDVANSGTTDQTPAPGTDSATTPPPTAMPDSSAPATQPTASTDSKANDWDHALNSGMPPSLSAPAAPAHTVTPIIDSQPVNLSQTGVSRAANTPMIDSLPTTQPSAQFAPSLYAADPAPTPVPSAPASVQPAPTAAPTPVAAGPRTHRVASGESPYSIAQSEYGNGRYFKRILAANPGIDPRHLKIGQILVIPELTDAEKNPVSATNAGETHVDSATMYTVVSGDTLEAISLKLYGSAGMIDRLYLANKSLIGPDENRLKIGWVLKLPQAPTVASAQR